MDCEFSQEIYADIPGFPNYQATSWGRIYSKKIGKFLTPEPNSDGYLRVDLYNNGKRVHGRVHRLVAKTFIQNPYNLPEVNHIDGNKKNNSYTNLEWTTSEDNIKKYFATIKKKQEKRRGLSMAWTSVENDGGLMAEGDYEVICLKCKQGETKGGTPVIDFEFQVRTDIEQKYGRKHIFKSFFPDRDTGEWPKEKIGKYANALGVPRGETFELADLVGKCCIVHMRPYKGQDDVTRDSIAWVAVTKAGQIGEAPQPAAPAGDGFVQVDEEELPF